MRRHALTLLLILVTTPYTRADEATDLRDKALAAAAKDPAALKKFRVHTIKAKGTSRLTPEPVNATFDMAAEWPGKLRASWEFGAGANKNTATICAFDDQGWRTATNIPLGDLTPEELTDFRADVYAVFMSTLFPLAEDGNTLTLAGRSKVNGDAVIGLKVSRRPWPDVTLYFDETTFLLRKMVYRSREAGVVLTKEKFYEEHKDVGGLKDPGRERTMVQGREVYSWTEMEFAFPDKIDPKTFEKPR